MNLVRPHRASDEELLARGVEEPEAFGEFYERFEAPMLAFFYGATHRADIAADLTGEVFAAALASVAGYDPSRGSARNWLYGIARHHLSDLWERGRVESRARRRLKIHPVTVSDELLEAIERIDSARAVDGFAMLDGLPDEQRLAIAGRVLQERDYSELAASLRCSESVVRQRVSRGLRTLRNRLEQTR
ncbi:MAG: RNA polymerase sigma factor [Solirubrobacteraceae bacterium]